MEDLIYGDSDPVVTPTWDKATVRYLLTPKGRKAIMRTIKTKAGRLLSQLGLTEEDIFNDVAIVLYDSPDYDPDKVSSATHQTLEKFVARKVHWVIVRTISKANRQHYGSKKLSRVNMQNFIGRANQKRTTNLTEEDALDIVQHLSGTQPHPHGYDTYRDGLTASLSVQELCKQYEYIRFQEGFDLYLYLYTVVKVSDLDLHIVGRKKAEVDLREKDEIQKMLLMYLGMGEAHKLLHRNEDYQEVIRYFAEAIAYEKCSTVIEILKKYIFHTNSVDIAIESLAQQAVQNKGDTSLFSDASHQQYLI